MLMDDYDAGELRAALKKAFINNNADKIIIDSNPSGQRFLWASIELGQKEELIYQANSADDGQTAVYVFRPTAKLFRELGGMSEEEARAREALGRHSASQQDPGFERVAQ